MQEGSVRDELGRFMNDLPFLKGCDFCPGRLDDEIIPGRQTKKPLSYPKLVIIR